MAGGLRRNKAPRDRAEALADIIRLKAWSDDQTWPPTRQARGSFRNFSRNRPEATNLNHQYANRRVVISPIPNREVARACRD